MPLDVYDILGGGTPAGAILRRVSGSLVDFAFNVGGTVGPYELAQIKAENEAAQRKALERRGVPAAEIETVVAENQAELDRYLRGLEAHPDDPARAFGIPLDLGTFSTLAKSGGALVFFAAALYFGFQFFKASQGK